MGRHFEGKISISLAAQGLTAPIPGAIVCSHPVSSRSRAQCIDINIHDQMRLHVCSLHALLCTLNSPSVMAVCRRDDPLPMRRKRSSMIAQAANGSSGHPHRSALLDDDALGRSPRSVAAKARCAYVFECSWQPQSPVDTMSSTR